MTITSSDPYLLAGAFFASLTVVRMVRGIALRRSLLDQPNARSAHVRPTPRLGGIGIMAAFLPVAAAVLMAWGAEPRAWVVVVATAAISAVGLRDDLRPLPARIRFGAQLIAASAVVAVAWPELGRAWTLVPAPAWVLAPLSVLWIAWVTNLYNFMDGIDGLAAGQTVIAGIAVCAAAAMIGADVPARLAIGVAGAALGFLVLNFPPASIFMGDVGSTAIGFLFAALPFLPGTASVPVEVVGLAIGLFILDATTTLVRRLARGERFYEAHRTHLYQRPLALGVPHRRITLSAYVGMVAVAGAAVAYQVLDLSGRLALIAAAIAVFVVYANLVRQLEWRAAIAAEAGDGPAGDQDEGVVDGRMSGSV